MRNWPQWPKQSGSPGSMAAGGDAKMKHYLVVFFAVILSALPLLSRGQTSVPLFPQAPSPASAVVAKSAAVPEIDLKATLQLLQDMQATNAATIKKQEAALAVLDELEQAGTEPKSCGRG